MGQEHGTSPRVRRMFPVDNLDLPTVTPVSVAPVLFPVGLVQGNLIVRGQLDISDDVQINRLWKDSGHKGLEGKSKDKCLFS